MACKVCGKSTFFGSLCSSCRERQSASHTSFFSRKEVRVSTRIIINGKEVTAGGDAASLVPAEMLEKIAAQLGLPLEQVKAMLAQGDVNLIQQSNGQNIAQGLMNAGTLAALPVVECQKCHHKVKHTARCLYCGEELPTLETQSAKIEDVDQKFLNTDVTQEKEEEQQPLRDTFTDRLKGL